jgi:hypothetical protein
MSCTLWARGTGLPLTMATPLDHVLATIAAVPAWPVLLLSPLSRCVVCLAQRSSRSGEGEAWLVKPAFIALKKMIAQA